MKNYIYVFGISLMLILSLVGCSDKQNSPVAPIDQDQVSLAKHVYREFTGSMDPIEVTDPGTVKEVNGKIIVRGMHNRIVVNATFNDGDPDLFSGEGDLELNEIINFATGEGYAWGKLKLTPAAAEALGGHWELIWHGRGTLGATGWTIPLKEGGPGKDGALTGLHVFMDNLITAPADLSSWYGEFQGYIKSYCGHP
jgi:hypothetical protein